MEQEVQHNKLYLLNENNQEEFINNVRIYFESLSKGDEGPTDTWFPVLTSKICSPINMDKTKRRSPSITMTDKAFTDISGPLKKLVRSYIQKHKVCMCAYILSQLTSGDNQPITAIEFILPKYAEYHDILKMILIDGYFFDEYEAYLIQLGVFSDPVFNDRIASLNDILNNVRNYNTILIADLFKFRNRGTFLGSRRDDKFQINDEYSESYNTLVQYMIDIISWPNNINEEEFNHTEFHTFIDRFNPHLCTEVRDDIMDLPPRPFMDFKLSEFSNFAGIIDSGRCYSFEYYGSQILTNCNDLNFNGMNLNDLRYSEMLEDFRTKMLPQIGRYYAHLDNNDPSIIEVSMKVQELNEGLIEKIMDYRRLND